MVRATGAGFALFIPPDKTSIETAELPSRYPGKACSTAAKRDFWRRWPRTHRVATSTSTSACSS